MPRIYPSVWPWRRERRVRSPLLWSNSLNIREPRVSTAPVSVQQILADISQFPSYLQALPSSSPLLDSGWTWKVVRKPGGSTQANSGCLFTFWYLTNTNTGVWPGFIHNLAAFLKNRSSAAATPTTTPSVLLMLKGDSTWGPGNSSCSFSFHSVQQTSSAPNAPDRIHSKWSSGTSPKAMRDFCHCREAPEFSRKLPSDLVSPSLCQACLGEEGQQSQCFLEKEALQLTKSHSIHSGPGIIWWCLSPFPITHTHTYN